MHKTLYFACTAILRYWFVCFESVAVSSSWDDPEAKVSPPCELVDNRNMWIVQCGNPDVTICPGLVFTYQRHADRPW